MTILLGISPREMKSYVHTKACTQMFIATLFIIASKEKQPKCPVKVKLWYINSMGHKSGIKRNKLWILPETHVILQWITLTGKSQHQKLYTLQFHLYNTEKEKIIGMKNILVFFGLRKRWGRVGSIVAVKENVRDPCVDGMLVSLTNQCQHPDCGIVPYFYHGETRQFTVISALSFTTTCEFTVNSKF